MQLCYDFYLVEANPHDLLRDRAYDSDELDATSREQGVQMIAPHRNNRRKPPTQDRRRLQRISEALCGGGVLCMAWKQACRSDPVGVPSRELSRLRPARVRHDPAGVFLR